MRFPLKIRLGAATAPENNLAIRRLFGQDDSADVILRYGKDQLQVVLAHGAVLAAHSESLRLALNRTSCAGGRKSVEVTEEVKPAIFLVGEAAQFPRFNYLFFQAK